VVETKSKEILQLRNLKIGGFSIKGVSLKKKRGLSLLSYDASDEEEWVD